MKKLLSVISLILLISCREDQNLIKDYVPVYAKDPITGVCFVFLKYKDAELDIRTVTCVPCDSLKNVNVYKLHSY